MCSYNDNIRREFEDQINQLTVDYNWFEEKRNDIRRAIFELQNMVEYSSCTINNISECNFGGDKIISAIQTSQLGYTNRKQYYEEYLKYCMEIMEDIREKKTNLSIKKAVLPKNCGNCSECVQPVTYTTFNSNLIISNDTRTMIKNWFKK